MSRPTSNKAGGPERRVSTRTSIRVSVSSPDDDHDFASAAMVADGFRSAPSEDSRTESIELRTPSITSGSSTLLGDDSTGSPSRTGPTSSTTKIHLQCDSFSLRHDQLGLTRQVTNSSESTQSTAFVPVQGPYQGPSGPSHPYQMYPQNVRVARTMSTTTASTLPVSESSYSGPSGPSHPYGLYPQSDGIEANSVPPAPIPLGFHGLPDQYQRRIGPDGEDIGDIIGPDGHTEQLPPYTRYPEAPYGPKFATVGANNTDPSNEPVVVAAAAVRGATPTPLTIPQGAGGIGLATRNPEFESTDDLGSPRSRHSARSFTSDDSHRRIRPDDEEVSEKRRPPKRWQTWMRRRLWGVVPYWAILLAAAILLVLAAILGAVVGTVMEKQKRPRKDGAWYVVGPLPNCAVYLHS